MIGLVKQFMNAMLTQPAHVDELLECIEQEYSQGKMTVGEYMRLLSFLNHFDV